jgi:hypothetical protein
MMAVAASNPSATPSLTSKPHKQALARPICKPRANCLKPKRNPEKIKIVGFDLQHRLNYLKVDIKGRKHPAGVLHHDP